MSVSLKAKETELMEWNKVVNEAKSKVSRGIQISSSHWLSVLSVVFPKSGLSLIFEVGGDIQKIARDSSCCSDTQPPALNDSPASGAHSLYSGFTCSCLPKYMKCPLTVGEAGFKQVGLVF